MSLVASRDVTALPTWMTGSTWIKDAPALAHCVLNGLRC